MPDVSCAITLTYFEVPTPTFSYHCTARCEGWHVQPDGGIIPPSRKRVIEINAVGFPDPVSIAGFQVVGDPVGFPPDSEPWSPLSDLGDLGVDVLDLATYPPQTNPTSLTLDCTGGGILFYRLAVRKDPDGPLRWDDPKIYNDPDL